MRVLANEIGTDHWQWRMEDRKTGIVATGSCQNKVDIRYDVFECVFSGWAMWDDLTRELVLDMLVRNDFEYWDKSGSPD